MAAKLSAARISAADVEKVATLARLELDDAAIADMTQQLDAVLGYFAQLDQVSTDGIEPLAHVGDLSNVFSDDVVRAGLDREAALGNAPSRDEQCFRVPAVL